MMPCPRGMRQIDHSELDTYASIFERDIDLVLVAALRGIEEIRELFCHAAGVTPGQVAQIRHSLATDDGREADVELRLGDPERPDVIQIENKLDAPFQPGQPESYASRRSVLAAREDIARAKAVIFCPMEYSTGTAMESFDGRVDYEEVRNVLLRHGPLAREGALVIEHAILKHRRGSSHTPVDHARTSFFEEFAELGAARGLPSVPKRPRKGGAGFLWWPRIETLPQLSLPRIYSADGAWLTAKFELGAADIELIGVLRQLDGDEIEQALLGQELELIRTDVSLLLRASAPVLDPGLPLVEQLDSARAFAQLLAQRRDWWRDIGWYLLDSIAQERGSSSPDSNSTS